MPLRMFFIMDMDESSGWSVVVKCSESDRGF